MRSLLFLPLSAGIKGGGGMGTFEPPCWRLCPPPLAPSQKEKMATVSHFGQIFGFLPPQNRILPPRCPPPKFLVPPLLFKAVKWIGMFVLAKLVKHMTCGQFVTQHQLMRLFAVKLILSYEQKCQLRSKFLKNSSLIKNKLWHKLYEFINSNLSISVRKICFNPIILNIFNRFVCKLVTLPVHILVVYFQSDQTVLDKLSIAFDWSMIWTSFWCQNVP